MSEGCICLTPSPPSHTYTTCTHQAETFQSKSIRKIPNTTALILGEEERVVNEFNLLVKRAEQSNTSAAALSLSVCICVCMCALFSICHHQVKIATNSQLWLGRKIHVYSSVQYIHTNFTARHHQQGEVTKQLSQ